MSLPLPHHQCNGGTLDIYKHYQHMQHPHGTTCHCSGKMQSITIMVKLGKSLMSLLRSCFQTSLKKIALTIEKLYGIPYSKQEVNKNLKNYFSKVNFTQSKRVFLKIYWQWRTMKNAAIFNGLKQILQLNCYLCNLSQF